MNIREEKVLNRKELRQKCSNENFKDDVWYDTYDLIKIKFEDYKNVIPRNFKIK